MLSSREILMSKAQKVKVSWQVTGIRSDVFMLKRPFKVEEEKTEIERGIYLSPETQIKEKREQIKQKAQADNQ